MAKKYTATDRHGEEFKVGYRVRDVYSELYGRITGLDFDSRVRKYLVLFDGEEAPRPCRGICLEVVGR